MDQRCLRQTFRLWQVGFCALILSFSQSAIADDETAADSAALAELFGEAAIAGNVRAVRNRAAAMPSAERFAFLLRSIFPTTGDGTIRMAGEFSQTDPAPASGDLLSGPGAFAGGEVVSPVYDLLDVGQELGRLREVLERVKSLPERTDEFQQRARSSLLLLINLELGDREGADAAADELVGLVQSSTATTIDGLWPETLAVFRGVHRHRSDKAVADVLTTLHLRRLQSAPLAGGEVWYTHVSLLTHLLSAQATAFGRQLPAADQGRPVWHPVNRCVSHTRGAGYPQTTWLQSDRELQHVGGHNLDYLLYGSPLRGNYEVEADLYAPGVTQFAVAGRIVGMSAGGQGVITGTFQNGTTVAPVEPHWGTTSPWVRYRAVVRDGTLTVYLDGRQAHTEPLPEHCDPWIGVHGGARGNARIRDIRITGNPVVPKTVLLSALPDLRAWVGYHDEGINGADGVWRWEADAESSGQIIARPDDSVSGTFAESLLRYQRPLREDGAITYEFFYVPGQVEAHPVLDRLAFLVRPEGVSAHWITDAQYDSTGIRPENAFAEPGCRRGPDRLPLRSGEWNRITLSVVGATAALELNGVLIYERCLESTNRRTFGLFRYANRELRVRNVAMRGDWPTSVPATADQPLADPAIAAIDARLPQLVERFDHDFAAGGLPERFFRIPPGKPAPQVSSRGVIHTETSRDEGWAYSVFHPTVELHGDFDVVLQFDDLQMPSVNSACGLGVAMGDKQLELIRRHCNPQVERVLATFVTPMPTEGARHDGQDLTTEALAGTFRIVRRGDTVSTLFADNDSSAFRMVGEHTWKNCGQLPATLDLRTIAYNRGRTQVTWKRFQVAAERLMRLPGATEQPKPVVFTINADGSELQQLTQPMPQFVWHGSPEWSPDGRQIAFDAWTGRADTSRIYIMNSDGSNLTDLGAGIIPTFSPDGKRLAFTWSGHGMAIMNLDGAGREVLTPEGWGCQWSPNGRWLAYGSHNRLPQGGTAANLTLIDVDTREKRLLLLGDQAGRYTQVEWNMAWSPDSRQIAFKGNRRDGSEIAIVSVDGSTTHFRVVSSENISGNLSWRPDGRRVLLSRAGALHEYDLATGQVQRLPGHPPEPANAGGVWDAAGERIVFVGVPKPASTPWKQ